MDLFEYMRQQNMKDESPLASRLRPTTLDEVVGQQHIVGKDKLLYRAIKADKLSSIIFYGPPGTGKTTLAMNLAKAIAQDRGSQVVKMAKIFAADLNKKDIAATVAKIAGGTLIIEEAGDLDDETVDQLTTGDGVPHRRTDSDPGG